MVAIFTGAGAGLERGSGSVAGGSGLLGSASLGRNGEQVLLNAATGNLVIQQRDEFLVGRGPDSAIHRTYNSLGDQSDENGDNWRQSTDRRVFGLTGSINGWGSTVRRRSGDGSEITYSWDGSTYRATDGGGPDDTIGWTGNWVWTDGDTGITETYSAYADYWRLVQQADTSGNVVTYSYSGDKLTRVTTADGGYTDYGWSGDNIVQITTGSHGAGVTRTRYSYDGYNRLSTVTVDLTPEDHSVADGNSYVTTYTYHGASKLVASISQTDGSRLDIGYDGANRVTTLTQTVSAGQSRTTTIGYGADFTNVTDASGQTTRLDYASGSASQLTKITLPAAHWGAAAQTVQFGYNGRGDLVSVTDTSGNTTSYGHDSNGNVVSETDALGNVITRTYGSRNELLTETRVGSDKASAAQQHTSRFVYDSARRLRFVISPEGAVSEYHYDGYGQRTWEAQHTDRFYDVSGLASTTPVYEWQVNQWRGSFDKSQLKIVENRFDGRGNLSQRVTYGGSDWHGNAQTADGYKHEYFTYDQAGQLLNKTIATLNTEHYVYDGLGRVRSTTDLTGGTTSIVFNDAAAQTVVTLANGFVQTSTYDKAGNLVAFAEGGDFVNGSTATYKYDQLGRLRMTTDATGFNSYFLYDKVGRKVADINHYGHVSEYRYDHNDRLVATAHYTHSADWALGQLQDPNSVLDISQIRPGAHPYDLWTWNIYDSDGRKIEAIDGTGGVTAFEYDASDRLVRTTSYSNKLASWQVDSFKSSTPASPVLPPASGADKYARNFYDKDGMLIGSLDGEGYLTQTVYDAGGQKVQEIAYASPTPAHLRAAHSFNDLLANLAAHPQDRSSRYVYDGQGLLRFTIDALNQVTEFRYEAGATWTAVGAIRETIQYVGPIAPLGSYTLASVRGALASAGLSGHGGNRVSRAVLDSAGRVAYAIDAENAVTGFTYDALGQVTKRVRYANRLSVGHVPGKGEMDAWASGNPSGLDRITRNYYSDRGELRFTIDAEGFISRADYDAEGRVVRTVRWSNAVASADWWDIHTVNGVAGGPWIENNFSYDAAGRLAWSYDGEGNHRYYGYYANGTLAWDIAMHGHSDESRTLYVYDAAGRTVEEYRAWNTPEQAVTRYGYDGHGNLISIVDPNGNASYRGYDRLGRLISETDPNGGVVSYGYNAFGQVTGTTDARGHSTYKYYDRLGRVTHVRNAEDYVTETNYTVFGEVAAITRRYNKTWNGGNTWDAPGVAAHQLDATTHFEYDRLGRLVKATDAEGYYEQYTLNAFGQRTHVRNKLGGVTENSYDRRGLLVAETLPMASIDRDGGAQAWQVTNRFEYDARGNRTRKIEASGLAEQRTTTYVYDRADRLVETRHDAVQIVDQTHYQAQEGVVPIERVRYDTRGNVVETVNALGARTLFYYDKLNRKVEQIDAVGSMISWRYDANGNMVHERRWAQPSPWHDVGSHGWPSVTDQDRVTNITYDGLNRVKTRTLVGVRTGRWDGSNLQAWTADLTISFDYDANGNVVRTLDPHGVATHNYYDRLGRKVRTVDGENYVTGWLYDAESNVIHERRWALKTGYAALGGWSDPPVHGEDRVTDFTYDRNGRRLTETRRNVDALHVDDNGNLQRLSWDSTVSYSYNGLGQVTRKIEATSAGLPWDQHATEYQYDATGRLTREARSWYVNQDGNWVRPTTDYYYDGLNNLTRNRQSGEGAWQGERVTRYAYKAGGRLAQMWDANGAQFNYYHDVAGNLIAQTYDRRRSDESYQHEGVLYTRDVLGRVTTQALASWYGYWAKGDTQGSTYNVFGEVSQRGINGGWQEQFGYDRAGRLERTNTRDGVWRYYLYDGNGNQTLAIENEGDGDLVNRTTDHALYRAQNYNQSNAGNVHIDGLNVTINIYDRRGLAVETQMRQRELGAGNIQNLSVGRTYNAFGEVTSERDARGHTTNFGYNSMGRRLFIERPAVLVRHEHGGQEWVRPTERFAYDLSGRLIAGWDANGNRTTRALLNGTGYGGSDGLIVREHHADGGVIRNDYDVFGDARRTTDEIGRVRTKEYDAMGRLVGEWHANGLVEGYSYDLLGQRIQHWNNVYQVPVYGPPEDYWVDTSYYDPYYGWVESGYWDTHTPIIGYAPEKARTDYDVQGRVIRQVDFGGDTVTSSYTWYGHLHTSGMGTFGGWEQVTTYANGRYMVEHSDLFGHDLYKRDLGNHVFSFHYDQAGRLTSRSGGETLNYTYLNTGLVGSIYNFSGDSQNWTRKTISYGYDATGNLTSEYSLDEGQQSYTYWDNPWYPQYYYNSWSRVSQNAISEYDALGRRTHWREHGNSVTPDARIWYDYDANGNVRRTYAEYKTLDQNGNASSWASAQDLWYRYDSMNRVVTAKGVQSGGQIVRGWQGTDYTYDLAGQRVSATRSASRTAYIHNPNYDPWRNGGWDPYYGYYNYDPYYDDPTIATGYQADIREQYTYNAAGGLSSVRIAESGYQDNYDGTLTVTPPAATGELKALYWNDTLGRVTRQIDYLYNGDYNGTVAYDRSVYYNGKGQISSETVVTRQGGDTITTYVSNQYGYGSDYALGAVTSTYSDTYKNGNDSAVPDTSTSTSFVWYDGAVQSQVRYKPDAASGTTFNTNFYYNGAGQIVSAQVNDGRPRTVTYTNDLLGQTVRRDESDNNHNSGDPHEVWYRFGGKQMGYTGNNGTNDTDYQTSIGDRTRSQGTGAFRFGSNYGSAFADFDLSVVTFNSYSQGGTGGSYTVRTGETLASIAQGLWGDGNLWYRLAEANGISGNGSLAEGQRLTIPSGVVKNAHNARTMKPYDPAEVLGDTNPTTPQPQQQQKKGNKCGTFGTILLIVVAVAVTALTAGAAVAALAPAISTVGAGIGALAAGTTGLGMGALIGIGAVAGAVGSIASQGVGVLTKIQDKFNWKAVGMAAIGGGISAGLLFQFPGTSALAAAGRAMAGSALTQGAGILLKTQDKFDWLGVAAAGVSAAVSVQVGGRVGGLHRYAGQALANTAGAIASAAVRTLERGTSFGDNLLAALPDAIGSTIGNMVAEEVGAKIKIGRSRATSEPSAPSGQIKEVGEGQYQVEMSNGEVVTGSLQELQVRLEARLKALQEAGFAPPADRARRPGEVLDPTPTHGRFEHGAAGVTWSENGTATLSGALFADIQHGIDAMGVLGKWADHFGTERSARHLIGELQGYSDYHLTMAQWTAVGARYLPQFSGQLSTISQRLFETYTPPLPPVVVTARVGGGSPKKEPSLWASGFSLVLDLIPVVGSVKSVIQLATGRDLITGQELSRGEEAAGIFLGMFGGKGLTKVDDVVGFGRQALRHADELGEVGTHADEVAASGNRLLPGEGDVGSYKDLIGAGSVGDDITPHHIPSANRMAKEGVSKGDGISINMEQPHPGTGGRHRATFTYGTNADIDMTPRGALAAGIRDARRIYQSQGLYTPQIRSGLQQVIQMNRTKYPTIFAKPGR